MRIENGDSTIHMQDDLTRSDYLATLGIYGALNPNTEGQVDKLLGEEKKSGGAVASQGSELDGVLAGDGLPGQLEQDIPDFWDEPDGINPYTLSRLLYWKNQWREE